MKFNIGKSYFNSDDKSGVFKLSPDPSLLYNDFWTDYKEYVVSLSGNWRFELTVDSDTGRCIKAQVGLLSGLNVKRVDLTLPESERRELYFVADEIMQPGSGCYYLPFSDEVCYDEDNKCLSYGDHNAVGQAIEFTPNIIAVIDNGELKCIYFLLDDVSDLSGLFASEASKNKNITNIGKNIYLAFIPYANFVIQYIAFVKNRRYFKKGWRLAFASMFLVFSVCAIILLKIEPYISSIIGEWLSSFIEFYLCSVAICVYLSFLHRKYLD